MVDSTSFEVGDRVELVRLSDLNKTKHFVGDVGTVYSLFNDDPSKPRIHWDGTGYKSIGWYSSNLIRKIENDISNVPEEW